MENIYKLDSGKEILVKATRQRVSTDLLSDKHNAYTMVFNCNGTKVSFTFHDSVYHYNRGIGVTNQMIDRAVDCITDDVICYEQAIDLYDFLNELGYDIDDKKGIKAYYSCEKEYNKLLSIMTMDEVYELSKNVRKK